MYMCTPLHMGNCGLFCTHHVMQSTNQSRHDVSIALFFISIIHICYTHITSSICLRIDYLQYDRTGWSNSEAFYATGHLTELLG